MVVTLRWPRTQKIRDSANSLVWLPRWAQKQFVTFNREISDSHKITPQKDLSHRAPQCSSHESGSVPLTSSVVLPIGPVREDDVVHWDEILKPNISYVKLYWTLKHWYWPENFRKSAGIPAASLHRAASKRKSRHEFNLFLLVPANLTHIINKQNQVSATILAWCHAEFLM